MTGIAETRVLIDSAPGQQRALLYQGEQICEAWHDFAHAPDLTATVHRVRADRVFPDLGRATARLADDTPISIRIAPRDRVAPGDIVTVTITAARREDKPWQAVVGARLVSRDVILLPGEDGIVESRHLQNSPSADVKAHIAALCAAAPGHGVILRRTAGDGVNLVGAVAALIDAWRSGFQDVGSLGCVHHGGDLAARIGRALPGVAIDQVAADQADSFDADWDDVVASTRRSEISLASGGRLWFEPTRALTAIDADSGDGSMASLFAEAPEAIATQIRLRQTAGLVAIDMPRTAPAVRRKFDAVLAAVFGEDPRHPEWIGRTRAGLLECRIAHGRTGPASYADEVTALGPLTVLRAISLRPALATPVVDLPPEQAEWLRGPGAPALASLDRKVTLVVSSEAETATLREPAR